MKNAYNYNNILVTGGAGFIGGHFIEAVLSQNPTCRVINLDAMTYAGNADLVAEHQNRFKSRYVFIEESITNYEVVSKILAQYEVDTVVHFAAESHVDNSLIDPYSAIKTNVEGTFVLLKACLEYWKAAVNLDETKCRFHHISTDEVYGSLELDSEEVFTEESPYQPNSPYSASKASSDHMVRAYAKSFDLPVTITHSSNNFGQRQHQEKFIPTVIRSCMQKTRIPIYGDGLNKRDWVFVKDNCQMIDVVLRHAKTGSVYNIGAGKALSNLELCYKICDAMSAYCKDDFNYRELIEFVTDRPGHDRRYEISMSKFDSHFGPHQASSFDVSLNETIAHYMNDAVLNTALV